MQWQQTRRGRPNMLCLCHILQVFPGHPETIYHMGYLQYNSTSESWILHHSHLQLFIKIPTLGGNNSVCLCAGNGHRCPVLCASRSCILPKKAKSVEQSVRVCVCVCVCVHTVSAYILCLCVCLCLFKTTTVSVLPTRLPASCRHERKLLLCVKR